MLHAAPLVLDHISVVVNGDNEQEENSMKTEHESDESTSELSESEDAESVESDSVVVSESTESIESLHDHVEMGDAIDASESTSPKHADETGGAITGHSW